jgi:hypothetical protein
MLYKYLHLWEQNFLLLAFSLQTETSSSCWLVLQTESDVTFDYSGAPADLFSWLAGAFSRWHSRLLPAFSLVVKNKQYVCSLELNVNA